MLLAACAYIMLWMHLGSLENTQEARVALGYRREQLLYKLFSYRLQTSSCSIYAREAWTIFFL